MHITHIKRAIFIDGKITSITYTLEIDGRDLFAVTIPRFMLGLFGREYSAVK